MIDKYMEDQLEIKPQILMLDGTFGGGNHSVPLLDKYPALRVLGTDLDPKTLDQCKEHYKEKIRLKQLALLHENFVNSFDIDPRAAFYKKFSMKQKFDIILLDLGYSSYQLEDE